MEFIVGVLCRQAGNQQALFLFYNQFYNVKGFFMKHDAAQQQIYIASRKSSQQSNKKLWLDI
jgi:hypothetical protein